MKTLWISFFFLITKLSRHFDNKQNLFRAFLRLSFIIFCYRFLILNQIVFLIIHSRHYFTLLLLYAFIFIYVLHNLKFLFQVIYKHWAWYLSTQLASLLIQFLYYIFLDYFVYSYSILFLIIFLLYIFGNALVCN